MDGWIDLTSKSSIKGPAQLRLVSLCAKKTMSAKGLLFGYAAFTCSECCCNCTWLQIHCSCSLTILAVAILHTLTRSMATIAMEENLPQVPLDQPPSFIKNTRSNFIRVPFVKASTPRCRYMLSPIVLADCRLANRATPVPILGLFVRILI